MTCCEHFTAMV